jgi:hypothetical protein
MWKEVRIVTTPQNDSNLISISETQARQAFLNTLIVEIINPLTALKVSEILLVGSGIFVSKLPKRKRKIAHESGSKKISRVPPRLMSSTLRIPSPNLSVHTSRNVKNSR